ncbi:MAG: hypothetical protein PHD95_03900 [Candidatus ainarchaeum sp.]|nr:hypothetical protein [Candidatus ainarchaeum sp.]
MKKIPKYFFMALLLAVIFFLSGCVSNELSDSERFLCSDLSSKSFAFVPECDSQEKCFEKAESELFNFDSSALPQNSKSMLFSLENNLASSWLFFGKAGKNIKAINSICSSGENLQGLASEINELNHNLANSFKFSDKASKFAFAILSEEGQNLDSEKIFLAKEEPLFSDFILLNNNLNDLQAQSLNSESFSGYYLVQMKSLEGLMQKTGFERDFVEEETPIDFFRQHESEIMGSEQSKRILKIPFISKTIDYFVSFLDGFLRINSASEALAKMPAFEYLQAYNNLAGTENSAIKKFSELLKFDSLHRLELLERNSMLEMQILEKINSASQKIDSLSAREFVSFDTNFFAELYSLLEGDSQLETQKFALQDFSGFREKALAELLPMQVSINELKQKSVLGTITIGERTEALKNLDLDVSSLIENLSFLESEAISGLEVLCEERTGKISDFLDEQEKGLFLQSESDLAARLRFRISEFKEAEDFDKKLFLCKSAIEEFNDLKLSVQDSKEYLLKQALSLDNCFESLEKIFSSRQPLIDLSDFQLRLEKIKRIEKPYSDLESVKRFCDLLQKDTINFLNYNSEIIALKKSFSHSKELLEKLVLVNERSGNFSSGISLSAFQSRLSGNAKYFSENSVIFEKALPVLPDLKESLFSLEESLEKELDKAIADFASKNSSIEYFFDSVPELNNDFNARIRITATNPFQATKKVSLKIPFSGFASRPALPENMVFSDGFLFIGLDSLPLGISFFEFQAMQSIPFEEETIVLSATEATVALEKKLVLKTTASLPRIKIETKLIDSKASPLDIFIACKNPVSAFSLQENKISFFIDKPIPNQQIEIYFSIPKGIDSSIALDSSKQADMNNFESTFSILIKNTLPIAIENASFSLSIPLSQEKITNFFVLDSAGEKAPSKINSGKLLFELKKIFPFETKKFLLALSYKDSTGFWLGFLEKTRQTAELLSSPEGKGLLAELSSFSETDLKNDSKISRLVSIAGEISKLASYESSRQSTMEQFFPLKSKIEEQISLLESNSLLMQKAGVSEKQLAGAIASAKSLALQAESLFNSGSFEEALKTLFKANSSLQEADLQAFSKKLLSQKAKLLEKPNNFWAQLVSLKETEKFASDHDSLLSSDSEIENSIATGDFNKAVFLLDSLEKKSGAFASKTESFLSEKAKAVSERLDFFTKAISKTIPEKISSLRSLLESVPEETASKLGYVAPISKERLQKLELQLNSLQGTKLSEQALSFKELVSAKQFSEALKKFSEFEAEFEKKETELKSMESELDSAISSMKEDAASAINKASAYLSSGQFNAEAMDLISKSKTNFEKKDFLKSIAFANAATAMLAMPKAQFDIPVFLYPIIIGICLVFIARYKKRLAKEKKVEFRKILRKQE